MGFYKNVVNAIIIDDRGRGVFQGGVAQLDAERAGRINAIRPGSLVPCCEAGQCLPAGACNQSPDTGSGSKPEPRPAAEPSPGPVSFVEVEAEIDPRVTVKSLHWKKRVAIAKKLGADKDISRRSADRFLADLGDDALDQLSSEVEAAKG